MKTLYQFSITAALLFLFLTKQGWGQTTIVTDGFDNGSTLFSFSGGTYNYYQGNSSTSDRPAASPFVFDGTHSLGINNSSVVLTSMDINTTGYNDIQMTLKVAAFSYGISTNGLDVGDYIKIEVSTNSGLNYSNTIEVHGYSNAYWAFLTGTGNAITSYGTPATYTPTGGGNRTSDGYSTITITNLPAISNLKFRITIYNDNINELWIIDAFNVLTSPPITPEQAILMFSEYVEGSSNNKAIELYNGTTNKINLAEYVIIQFNNGASRTSGLRYNLGFLNPTNINPGQTYVIVNNLADEGLKTYANLITTNSVLSFNGDDALAIYKASDVNGTTIDPNAVEIDIFGKIGQDPGNAWINLAGTVYTMDMTLRRKISVYSPVITNPSLFDPSAEYDGYSVNSFSGLGIHDFGGVITSTQTLPKRTYTELTINGNGINISFEGSSIINNSLTISLGRVLLGNTTLTVNGIISISSPGLTKMLVLDDGTNLGTLKYRINNNGEYNFFIGDTRGTTEYSPAKVTFSDCTFDNAYLTLKMQNLKHPANTSNANYINRYWIFEQTGINFGTSGYYDIELSYVNGDIVPYENLMYFGKYNGTFWENLGDADDVNNKLIKTGLKSFSSFTGGTESGMPVHLSSFSSSVNGRNVKLNWITENEENNSGFEIEKSIVNNEEPKWVKIGFIQGKGNSNEHVCYNFEEKNLTTGKYKYRLKQIDYNGNFEYFELDNEVIIGVPKKFDLEQNYPNPFNPVTNINFALPEKAFVSLKIYDMLGKEVSALVNEVKEAGYYTLQFNADRLASGVYFYRLNAGGFLITKKMLLLR